LTKSCTFQKKAVPLQPKMNNLVKNSARLLTANVVAQAIGLVVYPILTRLYAPEDFGLLNLFMSIGGILIILSTSEYHNAIVLPKSDAQAKAVFHAGVTLLFGLTFFIALTIPFSSPIAQLFKAPELANWYWALPIYVFSLGGWNLLNYYFIRRQQFKHIAEYQVAQSVLNSGIKIGAGYAGYFSGGLIWGSVLAPLGSLLGSWWRLGKDKWTLWSDYRRKDVKQAMLEFRKFPIFSLPRSFVNTLSSNLPAILITPFFGLMETGFFSMAILLGLRPLTMISSSIYQTFFQKTCAHVNQKEPISSIYHTFITKALLIIVPCFALLYFAMPYLVTLLLGDGWAKTAQYLQFMLPWFGLIVVGASVSFIPDVFQQQGKAFAIEVVYLLLRIIAIGLGIWSHNLLITIAGYSCVGVLTIIFQLGWYRHLITKYEKGLVEP